MIRKQMTQAFLALSGMPLERLGHTSTVCARCHCACGAAPSLVQAQNVHPESGAKADHAWCRHGASLQFGHSPVLGRAQPPQQALAGVYHKVAHPRLLGHSLDKGAQLVIAVSIVHTCRSVESSRGSVPAITQGPRAGIDHVLDQISSNEPGCC